MGDPHSRTMDGGWNPGEVWPVPVECLLTGMSGDAHLMFGSGPVFSPHFRSRFQPPVHLSSPHLAPMPGSINVNVSIPLTQHSLVDPGGVEDPGNQPVPVQDSGGSDAPSLSQPLSMDNEDVLDSDEASEEDDEDEVEEEVQMGLDMTHHDLRHPHSVPMNHIERNSLVCSQGVVMNGELEQNPLLQSDPPPHPSQIQACMEQKENEAVDSMILSMEDEFNNQNSSESDPNSGFSVQGKMYFEGRVVLHLKQWTDTISDGGSGGSLGSFSSCAEQQHQKGALHGCAVCRLKSPHENHRNQKEAHRHTVKGVLFTFEDCIIVELYPEPPPNSNPDPKPAPTEPPPGNCNVSHPMPIEAYMDSSLSIPPQQQQQQQQQEPPKKFIHHLDVNCIPVQQPSIVPPPKHPVPLPEHPHPDDQSWWEDFESSEDLKRPEDQEEQEDDEEEEDIEPTSNLRIPVKQLNPPQPLLLHEDPPPDYKIQPKSQEYLTTVPNQLDSHSESQPIDLIEEDHVLTIHPPSNSIHSNMNSSEEESQESQESIPPPEPLLNIPPAPPVTVSVSKVHTCDLCTKSFQLKRSLREHNCSAKKNPKKIKANRKNSRKTELPTKAKVKHRPENSTDTDQVNSRSSEVPDKIDLGEESSSLSPSVYLDNNSEDELETKPCGKKSARKGEKPFKCEICMKGFTVERRLENHKLSHNSERSSQCEKCGKRFARKDKLMRHMYVHSEEKMFSCEICQKRFSRRDKLSDHLKSHGGADEIHNCPMCQKQFLRPDILKQHVKLHTMGNKHQCSECLRFVTGKDRLEKHMARHKEAKALGQTLLCPLCTKYFIQKQSLKAHIKKFHPNSGINIDGGEGELEGVDPGRGGTDEGLSETETKFKPYECDHCHRVFRKGTAFRKHLRKHEQSPIQNSSTSNSPQSPEEDPLMTIDVESPVVLNSSALGSTSAHVLLSELTPSRINKIADTNGLSTIAGHVLDIEAGVAVHCPRLTHPSHLSTHHHAHEQLLEHAHSSQSQSTTPLAHAAGQIHPSLSHVSISQIHHASGSLGAQQSLCGSSYVLAYPHYSYQ